MDEFNLLPIYRNGLEEISDGIDVSVPEFCRKCCRVNEKCKRHYMNLAEAAPGLYHCPHGFSSYVFEVDGDNCIFTCLRIEGEYDRAKLMSKIKNQGKRYREISYPVLLEYAEAYREYWINQNKYERYKKFIDDIFHDVRKFNQQIKLKNDKIFRKSQQNKRYSELLEYSKSIYVMCWFLTLRLNNHDFVYNEQLMKADIRSSYNIFKIIDKVRYCMKEKAESKDIKMVMTAERECRDMMAYDCIELLPFLILENAVKYSPRGEKIEIYIDEKGNRQHVAIVSLGPRILENEINLICEQGYRGENAVKATDDGMGIGLYTASCICRLNNIDMRVYSDPLKIKCINSIEYSEFKVDFWIDL